MSILCAVNGAVYIIEHEWTCRLYNDSCYRSSCKKLAGGYVPNTIAT